MKGIPITLIWIRLRDPDARGRNYQGAYDSRIDLSHSFIHSLIRPATDAEPMETFQQGRFNLVGSR